MESLSTKTTRSLIYMIGSTGLQFLIQFALLIILSRLLTPEDFGKINAALVVISFCTIISTIGIGPAIIQKEKLEEIHVSTGFTISFLLNILLASLVFLTSPFIGVFFEITELGIILKYLCLLFIFQGISNISESLIMRDLKIKSLAKVQVFTYFLYGVVGIYLALQGYGYWGLIYANLVQYGIKSLLLFYLCPHKISIKINVEAAKDLLHFGGGVSVAKIFNHVALQGDNFIVAKFLGVEALGLYSRAYQLMTVPVSLFGKILDVVLFPAMSKVQNNTEKLQKVYKIGISFIAMITLPFSVIVSYHAELIIGILFGDEWIKISTVFSILAAGMVFRTSYKISDALIQAKGAVYQRARRQVVYAATILISTWTGHHWGVNGVAIGVLVSLTCNYLMMAQLSLKLLNLKWGDFLKVQLPGLKLGFLTLLVVEMLSGFFSLFIFHELSFLLLSICTTFLLLIIIIKVFPGLFISKELRVFINSLLIKKFSKLKI